MEKTEDTPQNRHTLQYRMRKLNLSRVECDEETRKRILDKISNKSSERRSEQIGQQAKHNKILDNFSNRVNSEDYTEIFTIDEIVKIMEMPLKMHVKKNKITLTANTFHDILN